MKRYDKLIIAVFAAVVIIVYLVESITFEMTTHSRIFNNGLPAYLVSVCVVAYFCFKYYGIKKVETYLATFVYSVLLWVVILSTATKLYMLYHAVIGNTTETSIALNNVSKVFSKRSFTRTRVVAHYNGRQIVMETSRTNFFALEHKKAIKVLIGKAGPDQYYVTKIFWQPGDVRKAFAQYWLFWVKRNWLIPVIILSFALTVTILIKWESPPKIYSRDTFVPPKPWPLWKWLAVIGGVVIGFCLLLMIYIYIR